MISALSNLSLEERERRGRKREKKKEEKEKKGKEKRWRERAEGGRSNESEGLGREVRRRKPEENCSGPKTKMRRFH